MSCASEEGREAVAFLQKVLAIVDKQAVESADQEIKVFAHRATVSTFHHSYYAEFSAEAKEAMRRHHRETARDRLMSALVNMAFADGR